ncbi:MAG: aspartate aminotransferase family protein, partial [Candidatus Eremiobacteraeota bacterium]|nr:aspartate aminotransferase family protein [Candidatus Eremiobacteraeota bacterium]
MTAQANLVAAPDSPKENPTSAALRAASSHALEFLAGLESRAVNATATAATLQARFNESIPEEGMAPNDVIETLVRSVEGGLLGMPSGRFFAWVIGGALPSAVGADWLTSAWGQNAALYACSPAASIVESIVGKWLKALFRLPESASFALVTGCQMAHATCLAAARHSLLRQDGWDVETNGLCGAPRLRVISSERQHASIERAVRLLGLGTKCMTLLPSNDRATLSEDDLAVALQSDAGAPTIVVLQAGDINTGSFDSFETLIPLAKKSGAWVHIDGAFGLWASASPAYSHL